MTFTSATALFLIATTTATVTPACHAFVVLPSQRRVASSPLSLNVASSPLSSISSVTKGMDDDEAASSSSWGIAPVVGEADRAFRQGSQLEKNGQARSASVAFHEAVTLYQCYLESGDEFKHVTSLSPKDCVALLAYACVRLAHLTHDALGDSKSATRLYKEATEIDPYPASVSYLGVGTSIEASGGNLREAVVAYREARRLSPESKYALFQLAVALERLDYAQEAESLMEELRRKEASYACLVDSWGYVRWHTRKVPNHLNNLHRGTRAMLQIALEAATPLIREGGLVCEFGVASGRSLRMTQEMVSLSVEIHGFDTFTGLPQAWGSEPKGAYSTGGIMPDVQGEVYFHQGLFSDSIPRFLEQRDDDCFLAYANIDCDLYSSTLDILEGMHGKIVPGTILVFDEYLCHPTWRQDEFRAWREICKRFGYQYEYLGFSLSTKQAVVRVTQA